MDFKFGLSGDFSSSFSKEELLALSEDEPDLTDGSDLTLLVRFRLELRT